jgi:hypothetical protein
MHYKTKDMRFASFLWSQDSVRFLGISEAGVNDHRRMTVYWFEFEIDMTQEELDALLAEYRNGETSVEPLKYMNCMDRIRDQLKEAKNR